MTHRLEFTLFLIVTASLVAAFSGCSRDASQHPQASQSTTLAPNSGVGVDSSGDQKSSDEEHGHNDSQHVQNLNSERKV